MSELTVERNASHWAITLCRPDKLNALSAGLVEQLIDVMDETVAAQVPLVTFSGEGRCFSAGFDMTGVDNQSEGDLLLRFVRVEMLLNRIASAPCLTVAFAHGKNFGAGVDLAGACKVRYCAPGTTFRMPGLQFGLVLGTARFARLVGTGEAQRILATSATFDAADALGNGFIDAVVPPEQWDKAIAEQVARAAFLPPDSRVMLYRTLDDECADADLAALVRSAAKPGIKARIAAYRSAAAASAIRTS
jgi:enoyl-CoA hydratase/carnithine racemase